VVHPDEARLDDVMTAFVGLIERGCLATHGAENRDRLSARLRHMQEFVGELIDHAERIEPTGAADRR